MARRACIYRTTPRRRSTPGRQHVRNSVATLKTDKTGTTVTLPILADTLAAGPCGDLTYITNKLGRPFTKESFGNAFKDACRSAGISDRSAHGSRKIAATRVADSGATLPQMNAIFGWTGARMALHYIERSDRRRQAVDAMHKLGRNDG